MTVFGIKVVSYLIGKAKDFMLWAFGHNLKMYHMPILRAYAAYAYDSVAKVKKERDTKTHSFFNL